MCFIASFTFPSCCRTIGRKSICLKHKWTVLKSTILHPLPSFTEKKSGAILVPSETPFSCPQNRPLCGTILVPFCDLEPFHKNDYEEKSRSSCPQRSHFPKRILRQQLGSTFFLSEVFNKWNRWSIFILPRLTLSDDLVDHDLGFLSQAQWPQNKLIKKLHFFWKRVLAYSSLAYIRKGRTPV